MAQYAEKLGWLDSLERSLTQCIKHSFEPTGKEHGRKTVIRGAEAADSGYWVKSLDTQKSRMATQNDNNLWLGWFKPWPIAMSPCRQTASKTLKLRLH